MVQQKYCYSLNSPSVATTIIRLSGLKKIGRSKNYAGIKTIPCVGGYDPYLRLCGAVVTTTKLQTTNYTKNLAGHRPKLCTPIALECSLLCSTCSYSLYHQTPHLIPSADGKQASHAYIYLFYLLFLTTFFCPVFTKQR
jgi:hypothetical protein